MDQEQLTLMERILSVLGLSTLAAASRTILTEDRRTFIGFARGMVLAGFCGSLAGLLIQDYDFSMATQGGIVGISAFIADDLLLGIIAMSRKLRDDPTAFFDLILRRRSDPPEPKP